MLSDIDWDMLRHANVSKQFSLHGSGVVLVVVGSSGLGILVLLLPILGDTGTDAARSDHADDLENGNTGSDTGEDNNVGVEDSVDTVIAGSRVCCRARGVQGVPAAALEGVLEVALVLGESGVIPYFLLKEAVKLRSEDKASDGNSHLAEEDHEHKDEVNHKAAALALHGATAAKYSNDEHDATEDDDADGKARKAAAVVLSRNLDDKVAEVVVAALERVKRMSGIVRAGGAVAVTKLKGYCYNTTGRDHGNTRQDKEGVGDDEEDLAETGGATVSLCHFSAFFFRS
mmetsp:Transcript_29918/g.77242  ORF Transcript_29918/g.77242 Transcript_29918/m.77242 type:complete len:287 (-) Transcript_29918:7-867(-)